MKKTARQVALESLIRIETKRSYGNKALESAIKKQNFSDWDKRFVTRLFYGTLEYSIFLDYVLRQNIKVSLRRLDPHIHQILNMGLYQLLFMDGVPDHAVVSESVELAKIYKKKYKGFVNGVLRGFLRKNKTYTLPSKDKDPIAYFSICYAHPKWLVEMWADAYGLLFCEKLLKANQKPAHLTLRVNTLKTNAKTLKKSLEAKGYACREGPFFDTMIMEESASTGIIETEWFQKGHFYIQDSAAIAVGHVSGVKAGDTVIDMCSAPGGKATHLATLMEDKGKVLAWDIHENKLKKIKDNAIRLDINSIVTEQKDAQKIVLDLENKADIVLLDAPCSGLGTLRRHPEIKLFRQKEDIANLVSIQKKLLATGAGYVRPGGVLLYSTCTLSSEENQNQIYEFLMNHPQFKPVEIEKMDLPDSWYNKKTISKSKNIGIELYPHEHDTDGFYMCKMVKDQ